MYTLSIRHPTAIRFWGANELYFELEVVKDPKSAS